MARNRFTEPGVDRIPLSDGDWIEVKKRLNTGEQKKLESAGLKPPVRDANGGIITPVDWEVYEIERAAIFLTDWSFRGPDDKPVPLKLPNGEVSLAALRALNPEDFEEINKAIFDHVGRMAMEKNAKRATPEKSSESPSSDQTLQ